MTDERGDPAGRPARLASFTLRSPSRRGLRRVPVIRGVVT